MANSNFGGDEHNINRLETLAFLKVCLLKTTTADSIHPMPNMLSSKEKRRLRRSTEKMEKRTTFESRGMDVNPFYAKTQSQQDLWKSLNNNTVTIAVGPAGVGKTLTALWFGLSAIQSRAFNKIIYVRSDVGCAHQRGRGALPGTMEEKMLPLLGPVLDNLAIICRSPGASQYLLDKKIVDAMLLEDIRGRSLNEALIIFDEAQNTSPDQVKTVLSRVGEHSRIIVTGDTKQIDLDVFKSHNGLLDCYHRLSKIDQVGTVQFTKSDIVRNGVIADILAAYDD
jgi:phosphate starvation-inducible PhoH-like protein